MSKKIIKCIRCKKETTVNKSFIGAMEKESNYRAVFDLECGIHWLCINCYAEAEKLAKELIDILDGNADIALSCILKGI